MPLEQRPHIAEMRNGHTDLPDLARGQRVVGIVAGLGREIEGDGQAGLAIAFDLPTQTGSQSPARRG